MALEQSYPPLVERSPNLGLPSMSLMSPPPYKRDYSDERSLRLPEYRSIIGGNASPHTSTRPRMENQENSSKKNGCATNRCSGTRGKGAEESSLVIEPPSSVLIAPPLPTSSGGGTKVGEAGFVRCCIIRENRVQPRYTLSFQGTSLGKEKTVMVAERYSGKKAAKYHLFDLTRGGPSGSKKLVKKGGGYLGKLRRDTRSNAGYSLFNSTDPNEQVAAFEYGTTSLATQLRDGQPPRRLTVALGGTDGEGRTKSTRVTLRHQMMDFIRVGADNKHQGPNSKGSKQADNDLVIVRTKEPVYDGSQYRLNFNGRVTTPSVKNMQLLDDHGSMVAQFGRVGQDRFHLDYRAPFNAFQAFAMALTQFDQ